MDADVLARLRSARAAARELAWAQTAKTRGRLPMSGAAGQLIPGLVLGPDASIVICHSLATTGCSASSLLVRGR